MDVFMKNVIATRPLSLPKGRLLTIFIFAAFFALSACDDSSSAGGGDDGETSALSSSAKVTEPAEVTAFTVGFHRNSDAVLIDNHVKTLTRLPVRCIKDSE